MSAPKPTFKGPAHGKPPLTPKRTPQASDSKRSGREHWRDANAPNGGAKCSVAARVVATSSATAVGGASTSTSLITSAKSSAVARFILGWNAYNEYDHGLALKYFEAALQLQPTFGAALFMRSRCLCEIGDVASAAVDLKAAFKLQTKSQLMWVFASVLAVKLGRSAEERLFYFDKAEQLGNLGVELLLTRADIHLGLARYDLAERDIQSALKRYPTYPTAYSARAYLKCLRDHDYKGALDDWKLSVNFCDLYPTVKHGMLPLFLLRYGRLLRILGRFAEAAGQLELGRLLVREDSQIPRFDLEMDLCRQKKTLDTIALPKTASKQPIKDTPRLLNESECGTMNDIYGQFQDRCSAICVACQLNAASTVFHPCGHSVTCGYCGPILPICPVCVTMVRPRK
jgi:tetratricopeptide (TPR) repeat protein